MSDDPLMAGAAQDDPGSDRTAQMIAQVRGGSSEALGQLMDSCRRYLLLVARTELTDAVQGKVGASDIVQETFLVAQRNFARFHGDSAAQLRAWLRRILLHTLSGAARAYSQTAMRDIARERPWQQDSRTSAGAAAVSTHDPTPSQCAIDREDHERLEAALAVLPAQYLNVIVLRNRERKSFIEIAEELHGTPESVRKLWLRAIERLQREFARSQSLEPSQESLGDARS